MKNQDKPINTVFTQHGTVYESGLTKLEYTSIQAMNGLTCNHELLKDIMSNNSDFKNLLFHEAIAIVSIKIAKELLNQLEKNNQ